MISGKVIGEVWASKKAAKLEGRRLLLIGVPSEDRVIVAIDTLDARTGQDVLVAVGSGARNVLKAGPDNRALLCDAAVALLLEEES
jgi:ethanolamine utilization protein EutN